MIKANITPLYFELIEYLTSREKNEHRCVGSKQDQQHVGRTPRRSRHRFIPVSATPKRVATRTPKQHNNCCAVT